MARMVPFPMLPTQSSSERRLYEGFLGQLDDAYVVYHSVDWVLADDRGSRVEGEADFVIAHPQHGVLAVEAKGGRVAYNPDTRRWRQIGRRGQHPIDDPFRQAKGEMRSLVEILEHQPGYERWRPTFGYAVAFTDGTYEREAHPGAPVDIAIDRRHLEGLGERVRQIFEHWRRPGRRFGSEGMDALSAALGFRVEIRTPLKVEFDEEDRKIVELTDDQKWTLGWISHLERAAVVGPAGSGKTLLAVAIAQKYGNGGNPTLLTCFNKALAADLRERTVGTLHLDVLHFHDLCWRMAEEAGLDMPDVEEVTEGSDLFEDRLPELLEEASRKLGPRYAVIVVDEAQDFREHWWPALLATHRDPDHGRLYLFADDNQNLYGGALPVEDIERCPPLPHNLRNTKAIHEFVSVFHRSEQPPLSKGPEGRPVDVLGYRDDDHLARQLAVVLRNLTEEEHVPVEDIVVLTPSGKGKSRLRARDKVDGFRLSDRPEKDAVWATSVHSFKGLERPVVILAELGDKHLEDLDRYLYVGGSRARNHLLVLATEPVAHELRERTGLDRG
jgi:AAA domain/UvrD-like helicase C-terminal domain/Nuclease-related domain